MTTVAKVILIDPVEKKIRITNIEKDAKGNFLKSIYALLGCDRITAAGDVTNSDVIYADDEALLKNYDTEEQANYAPAFICKPWNPGPIVGKAIIVGTTSNGETSSVSEAAIKELYARCNKKDFRWAKVDTGAEQYFIE